MNKHMSPHPGPVWFLSVAGIGSAAGALQALWQLRWSSLVLLGCCWLVLVGLVVELGLWAMRSPRTVRSADVMPLWDVVAIAVLTTGSATATVVPAWWPGIADVAWGVNLVTWLAGSALGLASDGVFSLRLFSGGNDRPAMVWGLAAVCPMTSATSGALLVPHVATSWRVALLAAAVGSFCGALFMGLLVLAKAVHYALRIESLPRAAQCAAWIPVALVGQSVAAAQAIAQQGASMLVTSYAAQVHASANAFSWLVLALGVPVVAWAAMSVAHSLRARRQVTPSWWAICFPMSSMALGADLFARGGRHPLLEIATLAWTAGTCFLVVVCVVVTANTLRRGLKRS